MFGFYISLAFLGLAAVDPIGIAIMPILLIQRHPYKRSLIFLSGSFVSLMVMGLLFSKGLGNLLLNFETHNPWFVPAIEYIAAGVLLIIAITLYVRQLRGETAAEPSVRAQRWLGLNNLYLFLLGALVVAIQSVVDVVFVLAMVRVGQSQLSSPILIGAVATYSAAALALQLSVVVVFQLTPVEHRDRWLAKVHNLLAKYSNPALIIISLGLSCLLFILAI